MHINTNEATIWRAGRHDGFFYYSDAKSKLLIDAAMAAARSERSFCLIWLRWLTCGIKERSPESLLKMSILEVTAEGEVRMVRAAGGSGEGKRSEAEEESEGEA